MTDEQRAARGFQAQRALEEFLDPALDSVIGTYVERLKDLAAREPWSHGKITALANAQRIAEEVRTQIKAIVIDGEDARRKVKRAQDMEKLTPARRRLLSIGSY